MKNIKQQSRSYILAAACPLLLTTFLLSSNNASAQRGEYPDYSRWSIGVNAGIPFFWGDMTSFAHDKTYVGVYGGLEFDYKPSPIWGLSLTLDYGQGKVGSYGNSTAFLLDNHGQKWCCPPVTSIIAPYGSLYGQINYFSAGLHVDLNMNRILAPTAEPSRWTVLLSPAVYIQQYSPKIYNISTGRRFTDGSLNNNLTASLGGDVALRFRASRGVDLQLRTGAIWITDPHFEGINSPTHSLANVSWNSSIGVVFKINNKAKKDNILYASSNYQQYCEPVIEEVVVVEQHRVRPTPAVAPAKAAVAAPLADTLLSLPSIHFKRDSVEIDVNKYSGDLAIILNAVNSRPTSAIVLNGYVDRTGSAKANRDVSMERARSMYDYLVEHGVDPTRITIGYTGFDNSLSTRDAYTIKARRVDTKIKK